MIEAPLALAFGAGLLATVNPCGFAMLPAYLSYFMGLNDDADRGRGSSLGSALTVGAVVSAGFLLVFGVAGILITLGVRLIIDLIPWLALIVGFAVVVLGIALIRGYELTIGLPKAKKASKRRGYGSVFAFGVSYAVASLSCTLPVFLTVVATQVTNGTFISGLATFTAYGLGMSLVLVAITVALALGKNTFVSRLRGSVRYVSRVSGFILVLAGAYIIWFWTTNIVSGAGALGNAGAFRFVEGLSQWALNMIGSNPLLWGLGMVAVIVFAGLALAVGGRRTRAVGAAFDGEADRESEPADVG
jgi:cytochrome c biogenesis protein CcdA